MKALLGAGVAAALLSAGLWWVAAGRKPAPLPPELAAYAPPKLAEPANLPSQLPAGLVEGDAGEEYARILAARRARLELEEGAGSGGRKKGEEALSPGEVQLLEAALRKSRCTLYGRHIAPASLKEYLAHVNAFQSFYMAASGYLRAPADAARRRKDWAQAESLYRRMTLFGWHMAQDWDPLAQALGSNTVMSGLIGQSAARKAAAGTGMDLTAAKAMLEMSAYTPDSEALGSIAAEAAEPERLEAAAGRLRGPAERRAYAVWTLGFAAIASSREEAQAAAASPRRSGFFERLSRDPDPRLSALAASYGRMMRELDRDLAARSPEERRSIRESILSRLPTLGGRGK